MCELVSATTSMKVCRDHPTIKYTGDSALYTGLLDIWTELIQRKYCIRKYWEFEGLGFNPNLGILGMPQIPTLRISRTLTGEHWSSMIILVLGEAHHHRVVLQNRSVMKRRNYDNGKEIHGNTDIICGNMWKYMELQLCFTGNLDLIWDLSLPRWTPGWRFDLLIHSPRRQSLANCMLWSGSRCTLD